MAVQTAVSVIIGAELGGTFKGAFGDAKSQLTTLGSAIKGLDNASANAKAFAQLKTDTAAAKNEWKAAEERMRALSAEIAKTDKPSKELQANFRAASKEFPDGTPLPAITIQGSDITSIFEKGGDHAK